jgi:DNA-binding LytR/AlgR family response regulator
MKKNEIVFHNEALIIEENSHIVSIMYKDIASIVCDAPYLKISTIDGKKRFIYYCLEDLADSLPSSFVLCNRSAIINLIHVDSLQCKMSKWFFILKTGKHIPVARRKKQEIKAKWKSF